MKLDSHAPPMFQDQLVPKRARLAGWAALVQGLGVEAPIRAPSAVADSHIRGSQRAENVWTIFDKRYWPGEAVTDHLTFALRHEPLDPLVLKRVLDAIPSDVMVTFVGSAPTGAVARRAWFFYETLTGTRLDLDDAPSVTAIEAIDPKRYITGTPQLSRRHRVRDNLLGHGRYCPFIRRTEALEAWLARGLADKVAEAIGRTSGGLIARAANFLLLADSRASFEIEGERPPRNRLERWGRAVLQAGRHALTLDELNRLHGVLIEDTRFVRAGLRLDGVFIGERDHLHDPLPEFIGASPEDLADLVDGMLSVNQRMGESDVHPVLQAAATAFGFVYIHPYQDGNGRLHRCLIHHVLAMRGFTPEGMVFPVSSVMLDRIDDYRRTLQRHSGALMPFITWQPTPPPHRNVEVLNDTADLYRYFDCTDAAEFLFACVQRAIEHDLPNEIEYLHRQDEAMQRIMEAVEMPDRVAQDLIMFIRQNDGRLSKKRREREFAALSDEETKRIEEIYQEVFDDGDS